MQDEKLIVHGIGQDFIVPDFQYSEIITSFVNFILLEFGTSFTLRHKNSKTLSKYTGTIFSGEKLVKEYKFCIQKSSSTILDGESLILNF